MSRVSGKMQFFEQKSFTEKAIDKFMKGPQNVLEYAPETKFTKQSSSPKK
jgi:hypothetical protein